MKRAIAIFAVLVGCAFSLGLRGANDRPNPGIEKLKALAGEWEGKAADGRVVRASYKVVSTGTTVLETLNSNEDMDMVTVYTADGDRVAMTHYCSANNQPRMRSAAVTSPVRELDFSFVGVTNLASPDAGHMHKLVLGFDDATHLTQRWTWHEQGKEKTEVFHFTRRS